ncbi:Anhydro-N-acetylmuramic acid kinase [Poriferisphaera corsica]|uniref:Anhydro-N-acetylmuramic acid kinase n=1 Tax=Poriferisphaera corsica TaxID=2528020 RepID=A0A517YZ21_9BACT|nr:anhydro-N-acetylmuramic acid kinase [Poriferisphaera corsica]QDU35473.1 Anhydro-N-acetylmuramic acid kinase [Poriferisphaera corsica]
MSAGGMYPAGMSDKVRYIVGCMTGTSLDGLDAALVRVVGEGMWMRAEYMGMMSRDLGELADVLAELATGRAHDAIEYMRAARRLGELYAGAVSEVCEQYLPKGEKLDFAVCHGQTIWHAPEDEVGKLSWQLFDPWPVVRLCGVKVCYDLRQGDLIAGGEGAPITPAADWFLFGELGMRKHVINQGGICNFTTIPKGDHAEEVMKGISGGDRGPSNLLIDGVISRLMGKGYDKDGEVARSGQASDWLWEKLQEDAFGLKVEGKTTLGREDFDEAFFEKLMGMWPAEMSDADKVATATEAVAHVVVQSLLDSDASGSYEAGGQGDEKVEVILGGGGAKNCYLVERIKAIAETRGEGRYCVKTSDEVGIPADAREAMGFAVLGAMSEDGIAATLEKVTGADRPELAGAWAYPSNR